MLGAWPEGQVQTAPQPGCRSRSRRAASPLTTATLPSWNWELSELTDAGGDDILAVGVQRGLLKGSSSTVEMPIAQIWTVRDGKLRRIRMFLKPAHAYRAASLAPPSEQHQA
jgi:ketosteroid isomerase-like protein